jgi:hypothetical protein
VATSTGTAAAIITYILCIGAVAIPFIFFHGIIVDYLVGTVGAELGMLEDHAIWTEQFLTVIGFLSFISLTFAFLNDSLTGYLDNLPRTALAFVVLILATFVISLMLAVFTGLITETLYPMATQYELVSTWTTADIMMSVFHYSVGIVYFGAALYGVILSFRSGRQAIVG